MNAPGPVPGSPIDSVVGRKWLTYLVDYINSINTASGVSSFNARAGAVTPVAADYDGFFLTPAEGAAAYDALGAAAAAQAAAQAFATAADLVIAAAAQPRGYADSLMLMGG